MNCDQVFDILTRGPFPTGDACDEHVEAHLAECPDCQRLADALRPAIELFQEAVDPEESLSLPGYFGDAIAERHVPVLSFAAHYEPPAPRSLPVRLPPVHARVAAWRTAAMIAIGVTAGLLLSTGAADRANVSGAALAPAGSARDAAIGQADWMELAALPAACYRHNPEDAPRDRLHDPQLLASANLARLSCCTDCHNAASDSVPISATVRVVKHCQNCHDAGIGHTTFTN